MKEKLIIYQVFPRILTNTCESPVPGGTLEQNGSGKLNHYTPALLRSLKDLGINTIWYTGIIEMATKSDFSEYNIQRDNPSVVKGEAGSPYAIKDYYDISPALAENVKQRNKEFRNLVKRTHAAGLKCIIDFVPNHTARCYHSDNAPVGERDFGADDDKTMSFLAGNDYYYITNQRLLPPKGGDYVEFPAKATGNDCFSAFPSEYDWYETVKLNYGKDYGNGQTYFYPIPILWTKMLHILLYWAAQGVDGFRCDMVFMVPLEFWHWVIPEVKKHYPDIIFIGEIYDIGLYRPFLDYGCFDYLYDKVGLYDTLVNIERNNYSAARITNCWQAVDGIGDSMLNFLENHDEVRFGSKEFAGNPSNVIPYLVVSAMISRGPFMIYYGQELGESAVDNEGFAGNNNRTTIFDYWSYDTMRRWYDGGRCSEKRLSGQEKWLRNMYRRVLTLCNSEEAIREGGFFDLMYANLSNPGFNPHSQFAFIRHSAGEKLLIIANFSNEECDLSLIIPDAAFDACSLPEGNKVCTELLHDIQKNIDLERGRPTHVTIGAYDAVVLRLPAD